MPSQLLQLKVDPALKKDLSEIADYKGIPVTSYIKLTLTAVVRKEKKEMFTANGLTEAEELEVLRREKEVLAEAKKCKPKGKTGPQILHALNA
ncbi:hypothetical protein HZA42_05145 [Candidatus Peregrinibacteria bacterium]|nr:hypothetical protein [Candidatus Peregrinibacteria bacterium]